MATLPDRLGTFKKSLDSLIQQVDTVQIVCNMISVRIVKQALNSLYPWMNEDQFSDIYAGRQINFVPHDNSLKDGSRFINANEKPGWCLVCDDDIEYPPDFVETMIDNYNGGFLSVMGKILKPRPLQSYYKGWAKNYKTFEEVKELVQVDIPGCCGILWHTDYANLNEKVMQVPNSDVCVGVYAKMNQLPCHVVPHAAGWLKNLMPELPKGTLDIYNTYKNNDKLQTEYINRWM